MAQKVVITLTDDLDGGSADETLTFAIDGQAFEIDLSNQNADKLREALAPFTAAGRRQGRSNAPAPARTSRGTRTDLGTVRAWANQNGHSVAARGRIPASVVASYDAAMSGKRVTVGAPTQLAPRVKQSVLPPITEKDEHYAQQYASAATANAIRVITHARDHGGEYPPHNLNNHSDSVATLHRKGFVTQGEDGVALVNGRALALLEQWETAQAIKNRKKAGAGAPHMSTDRTDLPIEDMKFPTSTGAMQTQWSKRTAKDLLVHLASIQEIFDALTAKHLAILQQLAEGTGAKDIKYFTTSAVTLRNLGVVGFDDKITPRGLDALKARSES